MPKIDYSRFIPRKKTAIAAAAAIAVILLYLLVRGCSGSSDVVYRYEKVTKGDVVKTVSVTGTLDVLNSYRVISKINGVVNRVVVDFNQAVVKGQLLATVDSTEIDQEMSRVLAQLERARLDLPARRRISRQKGPLQGKSYIEEGPGTGRAQLQEDLGTVSSVSGGV